MAQLGPVEFLFVEFPGNQFTGEIIPALSELIEQNTIRVLDLVFVAKDADGNAVGIELEELPSESKDAFSGLVEELESLISDEDVEDLAEALEPNSSAAILLFEHTWAIPFRRRGGDRAASSSCVSPSPRSPRRDRSRGLTPVPIIHNQEERMPLRRGPGLVRTVGRTAVIAGTASAVGGRVQHRQQEKYAAQEQPQQVQYAEAPPAGRPADDDAMAQLEKLADLHARASSPTRSSRRRRRRSWGSEVRAA